MLTKYGVGMLFVQLSSDRSCSGADHTWGRSWHDRPIRQHGYYIRATARSLHAAAVCWWSVVLVWMRMRRNRSYGNAKRESAAHMCDGVGVSVLMGVFLGGYVTMRERDPAAQVRSHALFNATAWRRVAFNSSAGSTGS